MYLFKILFSDFNKYAFKKKNSSEYLPKYRNSCPEEPWHTLVIVYENISYILLCIHICV